MPAKPIIDMIAGVRNLADASLAEPALQRMGYTRAVHRTDAVLFNKASGESHTHHLHLTVPGSELWRERLAFRDILRRDPSLISEYTQLKAQLLEHTGGRPYSGVGKRDFVRRVLASAGIDLKDGLHADRRQNRRRADAWVIAGGAVARAEDANVELDEVERFYTERDLRNQIA